MLTPNQIAWPLIANFSCPQGSTTACARADNMGWRYLLFTLGAMTLALWAVRFFVFPLEESPRFLIGRGRDADAVAVVRRVAQFNGVESSLTVDALEKAAEAALATSGNDAGERKKRVLSESSLFTTEHIKSLFETPKLAWSTSLLIALWCKFRVWTCKRMR